MLKIDKNRYWSKYRSTDTSKLRPGMWIRIRYIDADPEDVIYTGKRGRSYWYLNKKLESGDFGARSQIIKIGKRARLQPAF